MALQQKNSKPANADGNEKAKGDESKENERDLSNLGAENNQEKVKVTQTKVSSDDTEQEKKIWRKKETLALLELYKENIMQFENKKYKTKKEMWAAMAKALAEDGIDATVNQCDSKYRNLLATYKEKKDKRSGDAAESWQYMNIIDEIHGCKANIDPKNLEDAGSMPESSDTSFNMSDSSSSSDIEQKKETPRSNKRKAEATGILDFLKEESANKEKRHAERLAVSNRLLDILERKLS